MILQHAKSRGDATLNGGAKLVSHATGDLRGGG